MYMCVRVCVLCFNKKDNNNLKKINLKPDHTQVTFI